MTWVDAVRLASALVGLVGAYVVAPDAWRQFARWWVKPVWTFIRSHLPGGTRRVQMFDAALRAEGTLTATARAGGSIWKPDASIPEQIELLRKRMDELDKSIDALRTTVDQKERELVAQIGHVKDDLAREIAELSKRLQSYQEAKSNIDAIGFPVIGVSLVLAGLPEAWLCHLSVAITCLAVAGLVAIGGIVHTVRFQGVK